jgi:sugar lactone lactonase YvrE
MEPKIIMRLHKLLAFVLVAAATSFASHAQNITTVVGGGPVNLNPRQSSPGAPVGVRLDSQGNAYIVDNNFNRLLRIDHTSSNMSVIAGTGPFGYNGDDIPAIDAQLAGPSGLCIDSQDNVYVADSDNGLIREYVVVGSAGKTVGHLINVAGVQTETNFTYGGDGGPALSANLHFPDGCSFDSHGNLFIADRGNNAIRVVIGASATAPAGLSTVTAGNIYLFAGSNDGVNGVSPPSAGVATDDSVATNAALNGPFDVFVDPHDNVYVGLVGNPPPPINPPATAMLIRYVPAADSTTPTRTHGHIYTVAGGGVATGSGVGATTVALNGPEAISVDANGNVIFAEAGNRLIREVAGTTNPPSGMTAGDIYTIAGTGAHGYSGDGGPAINATFASPAGTFVDASGNLYIADSSSNVVRIVDGTNPDYTQRTINTYAGNGHTSYADAANATAGQLLQPAGLATSSNGDLVIADAGSSLLRGVPAGFAGLNTVAGKPEFNGFVGDGGQANQSVVNSPLNLVIDASNNGYIADTDNCIVRKVDGSGNINTIAGTIPTIPNPVDPEITTPVCGFAGAGGLALSATFGKINGVAVDSHGNVFFSDATNNIVWEYVVASPAAGQTVGNVYIVVGTQTTTGSFGGDNGPATAAQLNKPNGLFIDNFGNLFIADSANHVIREVPATTANGMTKGDIYTVAGTGTSADFSGDGADAKAAQMDTPFGIFVDANGNLFIADTNNHVVREVPATTAGGKTAGFIYTVAGTPKAAQFDGDGGAATSAHLSHPKGLAQGPNNSLLIADSDNNRIRSVANLTSNPSLTLSNYSLDFPNQPLLLTSASQPIIINNADVISLTLNAAAISGANAADFSVTTNCDNQTIVAGASCTVHVTFTPTLATAESALLVISDTNGDNRTVDLTGTSVPAVPGAQVSPTTLTFAAQVVQTQSAGQDVTLTNNGTGKLNTIAFSFTGANLGDFSETDTCGTSLNVGVHCTITIKFKPTATGARAANLSISDSATSSPQVVTLTGTGTAPGVQLSSATITFADQLVGVVSTPAQTVTVKNNGTSALTITTIAVSGANAADFNESDNCPKTPTTIAVNATCTISVTFKPAAVGARAATINITDDASGSPQPIALTGNGVAPAATLNSNALNFTGVVVNTTSATAQTVTLTNGGTAALAISTIVATGPFTQTNTCSTSVAAGANCTISVKFAPTAVGPATGAVTITDNATPTTQTITLTGTAVAATPGVQLSSISLSFADQFVGTTSATAQTVTVTNNGTASLTISKIAVTGAYSETDNCTTAPIPVGPTGNTCTINVKFTPTAAGANAGSITITDNATPATQTITLTGNGFTVSLGAASGGSTSATVKAGGTATYNLQFATSATTSTTPISITVACSDPASKSTCNAPATVTLTPGTPLAYTVTVSTTAASMMAPQSEPKSMPPANLPLGTLTIIALLFCIATLTAAAKNPAFRARAIRVTVTACLLLMPIAAGSMLTGCASSGGSSSTPPPVVPGTPANTYTVVITPTVGGVAQAATNLTLIVQ